MSFTRHIAGYAILATMFTGIATPIVARANTTNEISTQSYSVEQLESLIAKLQKQLAELKKGSKCFVSEKTLTLGDGEPGDGLDGDVRRLQSFLKEKSLFALSGTGYFGKVTRGAMISFQKTNGLSATGEFDAATREKAHSMYCKVVVKPTAVKEKKIEPQTNEASSAVKSISLSVTNGSANWSTEGNSPKGFKVVWSKHSGPTYPTREGDTYNYLSDPSANSSSLQAFDGSGTYYVRVCEYLGGACGIYSNEVSTQL